MKEEELINKNTKKIIKLEEELNNKLNKEELDKVTEEDFQELYH